MTTTKKKVLPEETIAASTIHPAARPVTDDPKSKIEYITRTIGALHAMRKDDLVKWYNDSVANIGHEADPVGDNSEHNKDTLTMKPSAAEGSGRAGAEGMPRLDVREDVEEMFSGQDLSEEFKSSAATLFEAAVGARTTLELAILEEQYEVDLREAIEDVSKDITDKLDAYLDYAVDNWMRDNEVAVESAIRNELMEGFIVGLRGLFEEHNIAVPEEKIDAVEALAEQVAELEQRLSDVIRENTELHSSLESAAISETVAEVSEGLTDSQREKFYALAEGISFDGDLDVYQQKLAVVKENYFTNTKRAPGRTNIEEETFSVPEKEESSGYADIDNYIRAMDRVIKK